MSKEEVVAVCKKINVAVSEEDLKEIMSKLVMSILTDVEFSCLSI